MVHHFPALPRRIVWGYIGLGLLARAVLLAAPEDVARDAIRYVRDARVQRAGPLGVPAWLLAIEFGATAATALPATRACRRRRE
jgi:hypothetical protein